jgi:UDP-glucuronate 4-epimerase
MSRYLVTGAAGFIGSKVCELLLDQGHAVTALDNLNDAYDIRLKLWRLARLETRPGFAFHKLDICDRSALESLCAGAPAPDAIVNLAARAGVRHSVEDPWVYIETNIGGALNLLEMCRKYRIRKFVLASTSSLYGKLNPLPFREDANTDRPLSPYTASKKGAEALCATYHHLYGIDITVFRYFTVYGPAGRPDMSPFRFVQWISEGRPVVVYGDGSQSRDYTYVDDVARGTVAGLKPLGFEAINLGSDRPLALMHSIRYLEQRIGREAQIVYRESHAADMEATWADVTRAGELLGWKAKVSFEEGMSALVDWYGANREWARSVATV